VRWLGCSGRGFAWPGGRKRFSDALAGLLTRKTEVFLAFVDAFQGLSESLPAANLNRNQFLAAMRRDVLFKRKTGLFGFNPRFVRNALQPVIVDFRRGPHFPLKLGDGGRELVRRRFIFGYQSCLFFTGHADPCLPSGHARVMQELHPEVRELPSSDVTWTKTNFLDIRRGRGA